MITLEFYASRSRRHASEVFRFRILAANGEELARSSEGYLHREDCQRAASLVIGIPFGLVDESKASRVDQPVRITFATGW